MGRSSLKPVPIYYVLTAGYAFLMAMAMMVAILFQVTEARLSPLELVLVGTALEATIFLFEMPTGVIADVYSRRASVLIGYALTGFGFILVGAFAEFETILAGSVVWGLGYTFISGARDAWISDEVGVERASHIFLRGSQMELFARIAAIPISVGLATATDLRTPILLAGGLFILLAAVLMPLMPESRAHRVDGSARSAVAGVFRDGRALVAGSPLLITVFAIALFYGMSSEGFDRLWEAHFIRELGFPDRPMTASLLAINVKFEPVVWFGILRMATTLCSLGAAEFANRRLDLKSHVIVSRWLFIINAVQALGIVVLALAGGFWLGAVAFLTAVSLSRVYDPLYLGWINQNINSSVRATVLSMSSQANSFGQIAGGPVLGLIGNIYGLRAALGATAGAMLPALLLYLRAFRLGPQPAELGAAIPSMTESAVFTPEPAGDD